MDNSHPTIYIYANLVTSLSLKPTKKQHNNTTTQQQIENTEKQKLTKRQQHNNTTTETHKNTIQIENKD